MTARVRIWWTRRTFRERRLVLLVGVILVVAGGGRATIAVRDDLAAWRARVAESERRLVTVRLLAGRLEQSPVQADDDVSLVSRVEATVAGVIGADRLTHFEPGDDPERHADARLVGVALEDVVRVLAALEAPTGRLRVDTVDLRRQADAPGRYDASLVIMRGKSS